MTKYFATADANGLISRELDASTVSEAKAEIAAAIESGEARAWIDGCSTDLEGELGVSCDSLSYRAATDRLKANGASCAYSAPTTDDWDIYTVSDD